MTVCVGGHVLDVTRREHRPFGEPVTGSLHQGDACGCPPSVAGFVGPLLAGMATHVVAAWRAVQQGSLDINASRPAAPMWPHNQQAHVTVPHRRLLQAVAPHVPAVGLDTLLVVASTAADCAAVL
jgi:hypothetical protein